MDNDFINNNPTQNEMPFAIVDGESFTELPKDLYIPPVALKVFLDTFEGPLDLLLYLIRKQNLNILDIPIAEITKQYVDYINLMSDLVLELAGEYLLMAAMLAEIKSRMLLPCNLIKYIRINLNGFDVEPKTSRYLLFLMTLK